MSLKNLVYEMKDYCPECKKIGKLGIVRRPNAYEVVVCFECHAVFKMLAHLRMSPTKEEQTEKFKEHCGMVPMKEWETRWYELRRQIDVLAYNLYRGKVTRAEFQVAGEKAWDEYGKKEQQAWQDRAKKTELEIKEMMKKLKK